MSIQINRKKLQVTGIIQGVGFRPFIYNQASQLALKGWASNTGDGVTVDIEGSPSALEAFIETVQKNPPINSKIESLTVTELAVCGYQQFELRDSARQQHSMFISPDIATCPACIDELLDPSNRRYQYAFTSCSQCGPRYSIIDALPYDRERTAMHTFPLCQACQREYDNPADRRFHAQTIACPDCGPTVELLTHQGKYLADNITAIKQASEALTTGKIVALKGIGGFQLLANATHQASIEQLRIHKSRPEKPFALMCRDIAQVDTIATPSALEKKLLLSAAAPIVLMDKLIPCSTLAEGVAPDNTRIGIMLPCSPLHHLLLAYLAFPLVATSGNFSHEPICIDNQQAIDRLANIADFFVIHNRPILRPVDDSVVQIIHNEPALLRAARGYAPVTIKLADNQSAQHQHRPTLAVGGHLKNTFAISNGDYAMISQHNGDLESLEAITGFKHNIADLSRVLEYHPNIIVHDQHPDYASSHYAKSLHLPIVSVQHHHAHLLSCMAEHDIKPPLLGIICDGNGLGDNGTLWGGEFFTLDQSSNISRIASLRPFSLLGGAVALKEPRRSALAMLWEYMGDRVFSHTSLAPVSAFTEEEKALLQAMLNKRINSPRSSSLGRLFDCVASLLDLCQVSSYEGQSAQRLEQCFASIASDDYYRVLWQQDKDLARFDWQPLLSDIIDDLNNAVPKPLIACKFHNTLVEMMVDMTHKSGQKRVILSGGSFQNRYLSETLIRRLLELNIKVYWQQKLPCNDGGLALGQLVAVANRGTHNVLGNSR